MRIGIDGGCWENRRGFGRFLREILPALVRVDSRREYFVFLDSSAASNFPADLPVHRIVVETPLTIGESATASSRRTARDLLRMSWAVARTPLDLFFFPAVYSYFPILTRVPILLGVHDTIAARNPSFSFATRRQQFFWNSKERLAISQARALLTVSDYSRRCIRRHWRLRRKPILVLREAASEVFRPVPCSPPMQRFILYVGGISPNKNLPALVHAFARGDAVQRGYKLLLVGDYQGDRFKTCYGEVCDLVERLHLANAVEFAGFVPDEDLRTLYNQASVFVMPSLDEGFGLPALEAMACGAPVVVSRGNSLEEVVGDAGLFVDPNDHAGLAAAIDRVVSDPDQAARLRHRSLQRASQFSWEASAERLAEIFEQVHTQQWAM